MFLHLCLPMIILGTITLHGARPEHQQENSVHVRAKRDRKCSFIMHDELMLLKFYSLIDAGQETKTKFC